MIVWTNDDFVQETMLVVHRKYKNTTFEIGILAWAYGILDYIIMAVVTKNKRRSEIIDENLDMIIERNHPANPDDFQDLEIEKLDRIEEIKYALSQLSEDEKKLIRLKLQGFSGKEMCAELGINSNVLFVRVHRTIEKLKGILQKKGVIG